MTKESKFITLITVIILLMCSITPSFATEKSTTISTLPGTPKLSVTSCADGVRLTWNQVENATGYYTYYRTSPDEEWKKLSTHTSASTVRIRRTPEIDNQTYYYIVKAYNSKGLGNASNEASTYWLHAPAITSCVSSGQFITVMWEGNDSANGYQLSYSNNRFFTDASTINITDPNATDEIVGGLSSSKQYYFKIRAYTISDSGEKQYSPWTHSDNCYTIKKTSISRLKYNKKSLELRKLAKQSVGSYDTLQGGCRVGKYGYYVMYNRNVEKCKIMKVNLNTGKRVKLSGVLKISHGNDLTYNPDKNVLVAAHCTENAKKVSEINPKTLKIVRTKTINLKKDLPGLTSARYTAYIGIAAIAYNNTYNQYVARIKPSNDLIYLDQNFNIIRYVHLIKKDNQLYQGMDTAGDYILLGQSFKGNKPYNIISVYDWNGNYISKINIKKGYELENIYHNGSTFHAAFYTSYYETYYVTKFKIKKVRGKKVKVKTKLKYTRLQRVNYIYKLTNL